MEPPVSTPVSWPARLLGWFLAVQLGFLALSNFLAFFPTTLVERDEISDNRSVPAASEQMSPFQHAVDAGAFVARRYAHLTGQGQAWWLFAPTFPHQATFPLVTVRGKNGVIRLPSTFEPADPGVYFRFSLSGDRAYHYDVRLGLLLTNWTPAFFAERPREWQEAFLDRVRRQWKSMRAYLRWRMDGHLAGQENPDLPTEVELRIRIYQTPDPDLPRTWGEPMEVPLARWRPLESDTATYLPVEAYDPTTRQFVRLLRFPEGHP